MVNERVTLSVDSKIYDKFKQYCEERYNYLKAS